MNSDNSLSNLEMTVAHLLHELSEASKESAGARQDEYTARPPYRRPDERIQSIAKALDEQATTILRLMTNETRDLKTAAYYSRKLADAPTATVASGTLVSQRQTEKCRKLLEDIANGLASIGSYRAPYNGLIAGSNGKDFGNVYRDSREYRNAPSVLDETLRRLHQTEAAAGRVPPTPSLGASQPTQWITLTEKLLSGHGTIKIPLGYLTLPLNEEELPQSEVPRGPYIRTHDPSDDYGNFYQKPPYALKKVKLWY